jgi:Putative ATP-dependant zinc protease
MSLTRPMFYHLPLIGWREDVGLPEFGSGVIIAKIDTGARNAALHAQDIQINGKRASFVLEVGSTKKRHELQMIGSKRVKSSNGFSELRPVVEIKIQVGIWGFPCCWGGILLRGGSSLIRQNRLSSVVSRRNAYEDRPPHS